MSRHEAVQVAIRVRPMVGREQLRGAGKNRSRSVVSVEEETATVHVCNSDLMHDDASSSELGAETTERGEESSRHGLTTRQRKHRFKERNLSCGYDKVFGPSATQEDVYIGTVAPSVRSVVEGINCTVFAYGQTGTGKTFTILGEGPETQRAATTRGEGVANEKSFDTSKRGVIPRAVTQLFDILEEKRDEESPENPEVTEEDDSQTKLVSSTVYCSYLQIYNENLYDLLQDQKRQFPLKIRVTKKKQIYVQGLSEIRVSGLNDVLEVLQRGARSRAIRATSYNQASSRSHAILQLRVETEEQLGGISDSRVLRSAKLNFVDLAGSEKWEADQPMSEKHLKEMARINKSLSHLGNVVQALGEKNRPHVPYRDSQLTRLLQDSLGGNTRTTIICTLSPAADCTEESVSTLQFADRAKQVMVHVKANEVVDDSILLARAQTEIARLRRLLREQSEASSEPLEELRAENAILRKQVESLLAENASLRAGGPTNSTFPTATESPVDVVEGIEATETRRQSDSAASSSSASPQDLSRSPKENKADAVAAGDPDERDAEVDSGLDDDTFHVTQGPAASDITRALKDDLEENAAPDLDEEDEAEDEEDDGDNEAGDGHNDELDPAAGSANEPTSRQDGKIASEGSSFSAQDKPEDASEGSSSSREYASSRPTSSADHHATELRKLAAEEAKARDEVQAELQQLEDIQRERRKLEEAMRLLRSRAPKKKSTAKKTTNAAKKHTKPMTPEEKLTFSARDIGRTLSLYQCRVDAWYEVTVVGFDGKSGMHLVRYDDDGTKQWHQMEGRKYKSVGDAARVALPGSAMRKDPVVRLAKSHAQKKSRKKSANAKSRVAGKVAAVRSVYGNGRAQSSTSAVPGTTKSTSASRKSATHRGDTAPETEESRVGVVDFEVFDEGNVEVEDFDILASLHEEGLAYAHGNQE
ncbi:Kinesin-like protein [Hondaea fermentalgiana]|uniref:Kinesin-like protein n=1 Tax=Hondaea fermentalgiana TaxID=2315210 RepID=A0A2R5GUJ0_9STRA|nr:Kinesin-like protein [Hondaea fermentalgiana]|eukprot:GBG31554.1 Kinesin-like protein [Hondaea fermentalgiana]